MTKNITIFTGGNVFIGDGRFLENASVFIRDEKIVKVSKDLRNFPRNVKIISFKDCTLMPGLIDCHTHISLDSSIEPFVTSKQGSLPIRALKVAQNAKKTLFSGVTTIRDMGGVDGIDLEIRNAIRLGLIPGPRILASGKMICITGGHGWYIGREADGPEEIVKAVREQIKSGADLIKFMVTGGAMTTGSDPGAIQMAENELRAGIIEAHKASKKTAAHAKGDQGIVNAIKAGIDSIEHGTVLTEESISLMIKKNIPVIFTLSALFNIENNGIKAGLSKSLLAKALKYKPKRQESIQMAQHAGVMIAMGTDAGTPFNLHGDNPRELVRLVEVGYSPEQALISATGIAAKMLGLDHCLGTIEEGKIADLIILQGNPLEDITLFNTNHYLKLVLKEGQTVFTNNEF